MAIDITRVRALCFDVDGTLRDTDDQYTAQFARWLSPFRLLLKQRDAHAAARRLVMAIESPATALYSLPDRLGIDNHMESVAAALARVNLFQRTHELTFVPGVLTMLEQLAAHYPMAIVSARNERLTLAFLERFDLVRHFDCIATSQTCAHSKPYPDQVIWAADQMGVATEECVMIGDTTVDMRAGKTAGAQTVGVLCGFGEERELRRAGADLIIEHTAQLTAHLLGTGGTTEAPPRSIN